MLVPGEEEFNGCFGGLSDASEPEEDVGVAGLSQFYLQEVSRQEGSSSRGHKNH